MRCVRDRQRKRAVVQKAGKRRGKKGFALIASLTLMMLLTLLAVGILAMAASQNRVAMQTVLQAEARQQALIGLDDAIAALQMELGPDRRVSASSGILSESEGSIPQHILGVWDSWSGPIYGKSLEGGEDIRSTYDRGRSKQFRRWLISSRKPGELRDLNAVNGLGNRKPGQRICMVGEGTLGKRLTARHHVYADMLSMPSQGRNQACFAWWIGGENQKSKITVKDPEETRQPLEILRRTWDTPGPMFVDSENLDFLPEKIEEPEKLLSLASLPLLSNASQSAGMPYFYDVTTSSYSLPVNVRTGGLKQDLCLLLNRESLKGTDFAARADQDCPIAENKDIPSGTERNMPIGSWQNLHAYYNCWPDGSAQDSSNFTSRLLGSVENAYTRMSGSVYDGNSLSYTDNPDNTPTGGGRSIYDTRAMLEQGSRAAGYARTPVMLAFMNNFGLVTEAQEGVKGGKDKDEQIYTLSMCFAPMFLWWNPYNVPMKVRSKQLWAQSVPYKTTWIQTYSNSSKTQIAYAWSTYAMHQSNGQAGFGQDWGNYFQQNLNDNENDIEFAPGEILFFSPGKARVKDDYSKPFSNPWILGYHPSSVAGYKALFYSARTPENVAASESNIRDGVYYVRLRLGQDSAGSYETDGWHFAPQRRECITLLNGYNGADTAVYDDTGDGKRAMSPQRYLLGWYNPSSPEASTVFCDENRNDSVWSADGSQSDNSIPYFIAALGVVAKSGNSNMDSRVFTGKDYRTKTWQHSNPAFWGSMLVDPDDQERQYHPYQLAALNVGAGLNAAPMDNIGNNGVLGITSDGEQVSYVSVLELPVHPPFSLAGLSGMRLQPGWYMATSASSDYRSLAQMRRVQYQSGVPGVGIGNAFADPCLPPGDVYVFHENNISRNTGGNGQLFSDFYDHGLLINDAMWDRWFCSSISDMPDARGTRKARDVAENFLSGKEALPVSRYKKVHSAVRDEEIIRRIMEKDGWKTIAQYLMIDGGFNVNSVSEEAWASVLQGLAKRQLVSNVGNRGRLSEVEGNKARQQVLFSRFMVSTSDKSIDSLGGYSMMQGSTELRHGGSMLAAWGEVRMLEPESIRELARQIVKQVRKRGPFLNMSDFINRRLDQSGSDEALKGALQAAIDETDINDAFDEVYAARGNTGDLFRFPKAEEGSIYTAAPGYLIQSDVLTSLGNILTVRDDTFTVRAYGCVKNARNAILAQAWCEATVQRTVDYVDPSNAATESEYDADGNREKGLTAANVAMGRQFRVVSFKWLDAWDI